MSLLDFKFIESDFIGKKIGDLSDTPSSDGMTAEALKSYFDYIPKTMIALGAVNDIIDLLVSSAGAESIGANVSGITGIQVQSILESVKAMLDDRYTKSAADGLLNTKADTTTVNAMVKSISYDKDTGTFTITEQGGSTYVIDTLLEKLAVNFTYDKQLQSLIITLSDGTVQTVPLSDFITETEILPTDTIAVTENDGKITLHIKSGSITDDMLSSTLLAAIEGYIESCALSAASAESSASNAKSYSDSAAESASAALASKNAAYTSEQAANRSKTDAENETLKAESWARGTKNNVDVTTTDETYHNNSKWFSEQAAASASAAAESKDKASSAASAAADSAADALSSKNTAAQSANSAASSATSAKQSEEAAATSEENALASKNAAARSASSALSSENAAAQSKNAASASETNAADSASAAQTARAAAETAKTAAQTAQSAAESARDESRAIAWDDFISIVEYTMTAENWVDGQYSFETAYPKNTYDLFLSLSGSCTAEQETSFLMARIKGSSNNIAIASGTIPSIDIPVILEVVKK